MLIYRSLSSAFPAGLRVFGLYWGFVRVIWGIILGLYKGPIGYHIGIYWGYGKENGNYYVRTHSAQDIEAC